MAWIESHQAIARHPKTRKAARLLDISLPTMIGHLHLLWWWALDFAEDGDLSSFDAVDIADAAVWEGDPQLFIDGMTRAGWLDEGPRLHDWHEYAQRLLDVRRANAERQRAWRNRHKSVTPEQPSNKEVLHNDNVTVTSQLRTGATVPKPYHNQTIPTTPSDPPAAHSHSANGVGPEQPEPVDNLTPAFDAAWAAYPPRHGKKLNKQKAFTAFKSRVKARDWDNVLAAIGNLAASSQAKRGFVEDMHSFLTHWQEWLTPEAAEPMSTNGHGPPETYGRAPGKTAEETRAYVDELAEAKRQRAEQRQVRTIPA